MKICLTAGQRQLGGGHPVVGYDRDRVADVHQNPRGATNGEGLALLRGPPGLPKTGTDFRAQVSQPLSWECSCYSRELPSPLSLGCRDPLIYGQGSFGGSLYNSSLTLTLPYPTDPCPLSDKLQPRPPPPTHALETTKATSDL